MGFSKERLIGINRYTWYLEQSKGPTLRGLMGSVLRFFPILHLGRDHMTSTRNLIPLLCIHPTAKKNEKSMEINHAENAHLDLALHFSLQVWGNTSILLSTSWKPLDLLAISPSKAKLQLKILNLYSRPKFSSVSFFCFSQFYFFIFLYITSFLTKW